MYRRTPGTGSVLARNPCVRDLCEKFVDHIPADIGQAEITPLELIREIFMIEPEEVEDGCLHIVHGDTVLDGVESELIRLANYLARLDAAAGEPHWERFDVMISPDRLA